MKSPQRVLKSILNLRNDKDWNQIVEWLRQEELAAASDSTKIDDNVRSRWVQGQSQALEMLVGIIETADQRLEQSLKLSDERGMV